jgi:hypothetical protein
MGAKMTWQHNDGGRRDAGYKGKAGDCVVRAIAIATGKPYQEVYDELQELNLDYMIDNTDRRARRIRERGATPRNGNYKQVYRPYLESLGWEWVPVMKFGSGCTMHLKPSELPKGTIIAKCSRHLVACIDGIAQDTYDCTRNGTRCVYGYFRRRS